MNRSLILGTILFCILIFPAITFANQCIIQANATNSSRLYNLDASKNINVNATSSCGVGSTYADKGTIAEFLALPPGSIAIPAASTAGTALTSTELVQIGASDTLSMSSAGSSTLDEWVRVNYTLPNSTRINWIFINVSEWVSAANDDLQLRLFNYSNGNNSWILANRTAASVGSKTLTFNITTVATYTGGGNMTDFVKWNGTDNITSILILGTGSTTSNTLSVNNSILMINYNNAPFIATNAITTSNREGDIINFFKRPTNTITLSNNARNNTGRGYQNITNSISLGNSMNRLSTFEKSLSQSFTASNIVTNIDSFFRSLTNAFTLTERIISTVAATSETFTRLITDTVNMTTVITTNLIRLIEKTQSLDIAESIASSITRLRQLTQAFDLNEIVNRAVSFGRNLTNGFTLTNNITASLTRLRVLTQNLDIADNITASLTRLKSLTQGLDIADNIQTLFDRVRLLTNSITLTDTITRIASFTRSLTNSFTLSNDITQQVFRIFSRAVTQAFAFTDNIQTLFDRVRLLSNSFTLTNTITNMVSFTRNLTNSLDIADTITASLTRLKSLTQGLDIADNITSSLVRVRQVAQAFSFADNIQTLFDRVRLLSNSFSLTNTITRLTSFTRVLTNSFTLSNDITQQVFRIFSRAVTQAFAFADNIQTLFDRVRLLTNSITLTDIITRLVSFTRSLTQTLDIADNITSSLTRLRELTDSFVLTPTIKNIFDRVRLLSNSFSLTNAVDRIVSFTRNLTDSFVLTPTIIKITSFTRNLTDSITTATAIVSNVFRVFERQVAQAFAFTDNIQTLFDRVRLLSNSFTLTNTITNMVSFTRNLTNSLDIAERITSSLTRLRQLSDSFTLNSNIQSLMVRVRLLTNSFSLTPLITKLSEFSRITSLQILVTPFGSSTLKTVSSTFSIPITNIIKGDSAEFDINVQNTGNTQFDAVTGIEVYNSSNNLIAILNSSTVFLDAGQAKTIIKFLNTNNLTAGSYRAEARILFDGRSTINITKLYNISSATNIQIGNYTNTSINFTSNTPTLITVNTSSSTTINVSIVLNSTNEGGIDIVEFSSVQNETISGYTKLGKFISLAPSPNITNNLRWYILNISYTDAEIASSGSVESDLGIWFYNTTTSTWQQETNGSVDTSANYVWSNITHFSKFGIYSTTPVQPSRPSTSSSGASVTSGGFLTQLKTIDVEFTKWSVLKEIIPGQSIVEGITVKNKGLLTISNLHVQTSGVPSEWVSVIPSQINLPSGESKGFNMIITVPKDTTSGDYKLFVTLKNSGVEDSAFMIIRVKNYGSDYDKPTITRTVDLDYGSNKTKISLDVNSNKHHPLVQVQEEVPKALAKSAKEIEFITYPDEIIQDDPIVQWNLKDLFNETVTLSYLTKGILKEFTPYIYLPLKQLSFVETKIPSGLKIVDFNAPSLSAGRSSIVRLTVENTGDIPKNMEFSIKLPDNFRMEPGKIEATLLPHERKDFRFSIIVPENATPGDYIGTGILVWDGNIYIKEGVLQVSGMTPFISYLITIGLISAIAVAYIIYRMRRRERPMVAALRKVIWSIKQT